MVMHTDVSAWDVLLRAELYSLRRQGALKIGSAANSSSGGTLDVIQNPQQQLQQQQQQQQQLEQNNHNRQQQQLSQQQLQQQLPLLHESNRHCARCNTELGRITNRGAPCRVCKLRVCKACREFTTRTTDWVCVVCHKQMEIQAASGDWLKDYTRGSCGAVDHLPTSDVLRKSIRRSWTISNPEDDPNNPNQQAQVGNKLFPQQQNLNETQTAGSYPSLIRHQLPRNPVNYNPGSGIIGVQSTDYHINPQRRVLRQSTLPSSLPNNDANKSGSGVNLANYNSVNLTAPTSPHQLQKSPLYPSAYNSDDIIHMSTTDCDNYTQQMPINIQQQQSVINNQTHHRLQVRRQSTLPANPCQAPMYMSTSPNRGYSRSPERSPGEQRYPPFIRQTSFPCNMTEQPHLGTTAPTSYGTPPHRTKILPSSPNYPGSAQYQQQQQQQQAAQQQLYDTQAPVEDMDYVQQIPKPRMLRQATLPNPDQHVKLLPTSPPKRQTSPQYRRSPEFMRQQTLPNPEAFSGNSLTVHPAGVTNANSPAKFMPISPRQKQNFLFPNVQNPRQFLSQQNVPTVGIADTSSGSGSGEQYASSQSVNIHRDHAKMIKVRSHSNEEYSITKPYHHSENRRILPEIPINRSVSRSPSRLVRQDCVKDEHMRTFGEAKQQFNQFQDVTEEDDNRPEYADYFVDSSNSFLEADEVQYEKTYNTGFSSEPRIIYNDGSDDGSYNQYQRPIVHSSENVLTARGYGYGYGTDSDSLAGHSLGGGSLSASGGALPRTPPQLQNRLRRRQSREMQMQQDELNQLNMQANNAGGGVVQPLVGPNVSVTSAQHETHERRKPEQMRSVSEDSGAKNTPKPVTRRSLSHPEKETQAPKKPEPTKIPSPKPLADILDKVRQNTKIPTPRRRNSRGNIATEEEGNIKAYLNERRNSDLSAKTLNKKQEQNSVEQKGQHPVTSKSQEQKTDINAKSSNVTKDQMQTEKKTDDDDETNKAATTTDPATKQHTTTLGEQEIQNAVEAAAVIFKKVVLQRRQEKKAAEEDIFDVETSSELEFKSITFNQQYNMDADEFKDRKP
ncbi:probable serine/threonine-protein kinase yakA [Teleopsis dalmanni]|uniref:probable serine/threonine-protein kinase yakA n=1 Tax=Teleopsis dalmanni TaxID=139649 RepID=UPI0018CCF952|nr:probable serine/threonine-protein kinase yakA [Teleopsis dalmanni]